ncbi:unnamed protein product [Blepharisma stoltei]|uniref:Uncharacterized protein n=1 Tax=Blepharisma stoltei TaxID=1481888 RepID=A0AAU9JZR8_9CILI|nr:unnamed protein product [Blepharisma stoltei]
MLWPNPNRAFEFKLNKAKQAEEIRTAKEQLKRYKKEKEEQEKEQSQLAIAHYLNVEEKYIEELRKRSKTKLNRLKNHVSWAGDNKKSKDLISSSLDDSQKQTDTFRKLTQRHKDVSIQYDTPLNLYKNKATEMYFPSEKSNLNSYLNNEASTNETENTIRLRREGTERLHRKRKNLTPPVILKQISNDMMFVHVINDRSLSIEDKNYHENSQLHVFRDLEFDKGLKKSSERLQKEREYYSMVRQSFPPVPNIKSKMEVLLRSQKPISPKRIKDIKKIKISVLSSICN